jgi:hypothetical protein
LILKIAEKVDLHQETQLKKVKEEHKEALIDIKNKMKDHKKIMTEKK